jgi:hypothetical protein
LRHPKSEDGQGRERGGAGGETGGALSEVTDDHRTQGKTH